MKQKTISILVFETGILPACNTFLLLEAEPYPEKIKTRDTGAYNAVSSYASQPIWASLLTSLLVVEKIR